MPFDVELGPLVGWRIWLFQPPYFLRSVYRNQIWTPKEALVSTCSKGHKGPQFDCTCGIYAYKRIADILGEVEVSGLLGRVSLWGEVIEHEFGYRSEFAYPLSLDYFYCSSHGLIPLSEVGYLSRKLPEDELPPIGRKYLQGIVQAYINRTSLWGAKFDPNKWAKLYTNKLKLIVETEEKYFICPRETEIKSNALSILREIADLYGIEVSLDERG